MITWGSGEPGKNVTLVYVLRVQGGLWFELVRLETGGGVAFGFVFGHVDTVISVGFTSDLG